MSNRASQAMTKLISTNIWGSALQYKQRFYGSSEMLNREQSTLKSLQLLIIYNELYLWKTFSSTNLKINGSNSKLST